MAQQNDEIESSAPPDTEATPSGTGDATDNATQTADLRGRVVLGSLPLAGLEVVIRGSVGPYRQLTDEEGRFAFSALPLGSHELTIESIYGNARQKVTLGKNGAEVTIALDTEVIVVQGRSEAETLRQSSEVVQVVSTEQARHESPDLGEVLARSSGVGVQRSGGLGSGERFSLAGFSGDQIRFFLDGVDLAVSGYPFGLANVPVNLIERVEIYRGVVPIRFGADALGGGINLVTSNEVKGTRGTASYQLGSFGSQRLTLDARHSHQPTGFFVRTGLFFDDADNDYPIDVEVSDERGRLSPAEVNRFNDRYQAIGGHLEIGLVNRPWADRLRVRFFANDFDKELQHNPVMTIPYGEVEYGEFTTGGTLRYEHVLTDAVSVDLVGGYTFARAQFLDVGECVYNWFGQCVRERRQPGEIDSRPHDQLLWEHTGLGRFNLSGRLSSQHTLRFSFSPTYTTRTGDERRQTDPDARDPLTAERDLFTLVSGLEYELDALDDRLENVLFIKDYFQRVRSQEVLPGDVFSDRDQDIHRLGVGNALRYRLTRWLYGKASYEWATRLPGPGEVFGNGVLIVDNLELAPERSHNANLGITLDVRETRAGAWRLDVNSFLRESEKLIVLLGQDRVLKYRNVFGARSLGVEGAVGWTSPGEYFAIDGTLTYNDFRNTSREGSFGDYEGDRIPNRPYLLASGSARFWLPDVPAANHAVALTWNTRYVHEFFRTWESIGLIEFKQVVPLQLLHGLTLTYLLEGNPIALSFTAEVQNITDRPSFDFFGVQRPGRAFYFKATAEF
ncbi:MAG: TonB-dependent siderophore myxochelin receptor MxcH [Proteobacteria bacterium]|nr:TonB-dependent siderophore myxochelin receptor MxcH [Pseudomonadota bacterium]